MRRLACVVLALLMLAICRPLAAQNKGPSLSTKQGIVFVYLRPLPQESDRLFFVLSRLSARTEEGTTIPMSLSLTEISGASETGERLFASAALPPGRYSGLSVEVERARLKGPEGPAELRLPEKPTSIDVPFTVSRKQGVVLSLKLDYRAAVTEEFRFTPAFSGGVPGKLATGLIGVGSSPGSDIVTIFDRISGQVVGVIKTGQRPSGLALDEARRRAYVANADDDSIEVLDIIQASVLNRVQLSGGDRPRELALVPDGSTLLTVNEGSDSVSFVDPSALRESDRVAVGNNPESVLIEPSGGRAFVFNKQSDTISVIDLSRRLLTATISTDSGPVRGHFNRSGEVLYVIHQSSAYLTVIDVLTLSVLERVYVGMGATALTVNPRTNWIYVARRNADSIDIYDPFSFLPIDSIRVKAEVAFMTIDIEGNSLFLTLPDLNEIRNVRLVGSGTLTRIEVGQQPFWVSLMSER